ncbi:MAG: SdrD B-like domain-containing protein [Ilumatobacteraceae bacterium]
MRRTEHLGARALAVVGLVATLAYLAWRARFSMHDTDLWLSVPALAVEVGGFLGALALAWALWPQPTSSRSPHGTSVTGPVDAVVRVARQSDHEVRATLLALRGVSGVQSVVVVDLSARPAIASLATEFQAVYAASDPADRNGLRVMLAAVRTPQFLLVDAGDVPTGDIVERLATDLVDLRVAVVQGMGASLADDSAEHGPNGRHELLFERTSLNPALGRRGTAMWLGTGSLVRTDALREITLGDRPALEAQWMAGVELLAAGWHVTSPADATVVAQRTVLSEEAVAEDRMQRARAARTMLFGRRGALRSRTFTIRQRLSVLAWTVRPLSGLRRLLFLTVLGSALLAGSVPFHASTMVLLCAWLPGFLYTSLGLALLSGSTLRPGDRARWSLHSIGPAFRSLHARTDARRTSRSPIITLPSPQYGAGLVVVIVALSAILVLRGISERLTHTLGAIPQSALMAMMMTALWTMGLSLDLLRVLARRRQLRTTPRVAASLPATLGDRAVSIVDLTALGAGLISQTGAGINERLLLDSTIPTRSGATTMRVACVVRNVTVSTEGEYRIGVEFGETNDATANALAEFCTIEPIWQRLGTLTTAPTGDARRFEFVDEPAAEPASGRTAVRLVSLLALVGVVASAAPSTADASASLQHRVSGAVVAVADPPAATDPITLDTVVDETVVNGTVVDDTVADPVSTVPVSTVPDSTVPDSTAPPEVATGAPVPVPGAMVVAVCSLDAGADGAWGTSDDTYSAPLATITDVDGNYELELVGKACWASVAPPELYDAPLPAEAPQPIDVSGATTTNRPVVLQRGAATQAAGPARGAIGDTVWSDTNRNGVQDAGEPGVGGVMLTLLDGEGHHIAATRSDAAGEFRFDGVVAGSYRVGVANLPDGFGFTSAMAGRDPAADSDADPVTGLTALVRLALGQEASELDVGLVAAAASSTTDGAAPGASATGLPSVATPELGTTDRVLPSPTSSQLSSVVPDRSTLSVFVLALACFLAMSILLGLARPRATGAG